MLVSIDALGMLRSSAAGWKASYFFEMDWNDHLVADTISDRSRFRGNESNKDDDGGRYLKEWRETKILTVKCNEFSRQKKARMKNGLEWKATISIYLGTVWSGSPELEMIKSYGT